MNNNGGIPFGMVSACITVYFKWNILVTPGLLNL
jgi:hypothetical protein